eukprot:15454347-Alexandrium_andersonii.AAC.1
MGPEIGSRIGLSEKIFRKLKLSRALERRIYDACIKAKLLYGLGVAWPHPTQLARLEAFHVRCLRRICGIPATL